MGSLWLERGVSFKKEIIMTQIHIKITANPRKNGLIVHKYMNLFAYLNI